MTRLLDIVASIAGLLLLSPLFVIIGLAVKVSSPGPVFHRAERVGRGGKIFFLYKFRSMRTGAAGPAISTACDSRITGVGRLIRKMKLDELPQLMNVLIGEMSLVGARPEDPKYVALYDEEQRQILAARPGMTSPASLAYRSEQELLVGPDWERIYIDRIMPDKLRLDLEYQRRRSVVTDIGLIVRTIGALLLRR
ncbi:MAG TPA: sugar transferase [Thermoanaerobaculia bacterium]|nr:sugar transferase [Thermoanaerobaculia bacterium]